MRVALVSASVVFAACVGDVTLVDGGSGGSGGSAGGSSGGTAHAGGSAGGSSGGTQAGGSAGGSSGGTAQAGGSAAGGGTVASDAGLFPWVAGLTPLTWTTLSAPTAEQWARDGGVPSGPYLGTGPYVSFVDAYCDPANDEANGQQHFFGEGHGDGTMNGVITFDWRSLGWSLAIPPMPPSRYPPSYVAAIMNGQASIRMDYPSGIVFADRTFGLTTWDTPDGGGWFRTSGELAAADMNYAAPITSRVASHMYGAACLRGSRVHYFYQYYGEADLSAHEWVASARWPNLSSQYKALNQFANQTISTPGTMAHYDAVSDRFFVLAQGGEGGSLSLYTVLPGPSVQQYVRVQEAITPSPAIAAVGRTLYVFNKTGAGPIEMNHGFAVDMRTLAVTYFTVAGTTAGTVLSSGFGVGKTAETIPAFAFGGAIYRWNYIDAPNQLFRLNLTPSGGTGTSADPFVLQQTAVTLSGTPPANVTYVYKRLMAIEPQGVVVLIPSARSRPMVVKLP